jgi:pyruvate-ferredoxin/flavodoxin oxidoreductase
MFRYNPALKAEGKNPFTIDSKPATGDYKAFLLNEARYASLTRSFPDRAEALFALSEKTAQDRYAHLLRLKDLYAPDAE